MCNFHFWTARIVYSMNNVLFLLLFVLRFLNLFIFGAYNYMCE